jgi:hypothetical protein
MSEPTLYEFVNLFFCEFVVHGLSIQRLNRTTFGYRLLLPVRSGLRARRRVSPDPGSAQTRSIALVLLPPIVALHKPFALLSSFTYPSSKCLLCAQYLVAFGSQFISTT